MSGAGACIPPTTRRAVATTVVHFVKIRVPSPVGSQPARHAANSASKSAQRLIATIAFRVQAVRCVRMAPAFVRRLLLIAAAPARTFKAIPITAAIAVTYARSRLVVACKDSAFLFRRIQPGYTTGSKGGQESQGSRIYCTS
jgi:hypothetical protein